MIKSDIGIDTIMMNGVCVMGFLTRFGDTFLIKRTIHCELQCIFFLTHTKKC